MRRACESQRRPAVTADLCVAFDQDGRVPALVPLTGDRRARWTALEDAPPATSCTASVPVGERARRGRPDASRGACAHGDRLYILRRLAANVR
jgi:hypothetical protein